MSWDRVYEAAKHAVSWGLQHRDLDGIEAVGVDEVQWHKGHKYQTVVYQLDQGRKRLLWGKKKGTSLILTPGNDRLGPQFTLCGPGRLRKTQNNQ